MRTKGLLTLFGVAALALAGCLERKETITVARDGAVLIEVEYSGKPEYFETGDALPSHEAGWPVRRSVERNDDGQETVTLLAQRRFEPREELPSSFAGPDDPNAALCLQFPTQIRVDRRPDGVYLHFRRTYSPRPWAYVEYWRDRLLDDEVKELGEKPVEELTNEEKVKLVEASAGIEFLKQTEFAHAALRELHPNLPQDVWLKARRAMMEVAEATDWESLMERIVGVPEEDRDKAFEEESRRLLDATYSALVDALASAAGWRDPQIKAFNTTYERQEKRYDITNELGGHGFKIRVEMPGEIVAHNADSAEEGTVEWEFNGDAFRDRPYELMVTCKLED